MPEVTVPYQPGTPCWVDLVAPDQQAALDFYGELFGWTGEIGPPEQGGYSICTLHGRPVAGIMSAQAMGDQPTPPTVWTTYVTSADAEATERAIGNSGGTVMAPVMDVMTLGRMLVAADPTGAVFGVWEPKDFIGAGIVNEPGALIWNELNTTDRDAAAAFYPAVLGIEVAPMEGAENYFALTVNGRTVGGLQVLPDDMPGGIPPHWLAYFAVENTDATVAKLTSVGGSVLQPPFDMAAGRMAVVADPQGAPFAVIAATGPNPT
ncbi:VOC family protein [Streptomyces sp. 8N706]|uniref:VOC family protein n=1 Tax=Streptomyces sp. 8N706 TaxID=3457416 RepID=UPI003FD18D78